MGRVEGVDARRRASRERLDCTHTTPIIGASDARSGDKVDRLSSLLLQSNRFSAITRSSNRWRSLISQVKDSEKQPQVRARKKCQHEGGWGSSFRPTPTHALPGSVVWPGLGVGKMSWIPTNQHGDRDPGSPVPRPPKFCLFSNLPARHRSPSFDSKNARVSLRADNQTLQSQRNDPELTIRIASGGPRPLWLEQPTIEARQQKHTQSRARTPPPPLRAFAATAGFFHSFVGVAGARPRTPVERGPPPLGVRVRACACWGGWGRSATPAHQETKDG